MTRPRRRSRLPLGAKSRSGKGYEYTKTEKGWELTHHIIAREKYAREIAYNEFVSFADGNRNNLDPDNIVIRNRIASSLDRKIKFINAKIDDLVRTRTELTKAIESSGSSDLSAIVTESSRYRSSTGALSPSLDGQDMHELGARYRALMSEAEEVREAIAKRAEAMAEWPGITKTDLARELGMSRQSLYRLIRRNH